MQEIRSLSPPIVTGICDPNKSQAQILGMTPSQFETWFKIEVSQSQLKRPLLVKLKFEYLNKMSWLVFFFEIQKKLVICLSYNKIFLLLYQLVTEMVKQSNIFY